MVAVFRFIKWLARTYFIAVAISLLLSIPLIGNLDANGWIIKTLILALVTGWIIFFWAAWQFEYNNGKERIKVWFARKIYDVKVSKDLMLFTDALIREKKFDLDSVREFKEKLSLENLSPEMTQKFLLQQLTVLVTELSKDRKLDDSEWQIFLAARQAFNCPIPETDNRCINKKDLGDLRARGIIAEGRLIEQYHSNVPIKLNSDEKVYLALPGLFLKRRKMVDRINYSGITGSLNLGMGFKYRVGSIKPRALNKEAIIPEGQGIFFVTSEKVGFHGDKKSWSCPIDKITDVQVEGDVGLEIFRSGRENPVLIFPIDLDTAAAVLNTVMNGNFVIDNNRIAV